MKAAAHAEIFALLAGTADNPVLVHALRTGASLAEHLMITAGPAAAGIPASSRQRLLRCLCAGDADGAAREMESHLQVLSFMGRIAAIGDTAVKPLARAKSQPRDVTGPNPS